MQRKTYNPKGNVWRRCAGRSFGRSPATSCSCVDETCIRTPSAAAQSRRRGRRPPPHRVPTPLQPNLTGKAAVYPRIDPLPAAAQSPRRGRRPLPGRRFPHAPATCGPGRPAVRGRGAGPRRPAVPPRRPADAVPGLQVLEAHPAPRESTDRRPAIGDSTKFRGGFLWRKRSRPAEKGGLGLACSGVTVWFGFVSWSLIGDSGIRTHSWGRGSQGR